MSEKSTEGTSPFVAVLNYLASDEYAERVKAESDKYYSHPSILAQVEKQNKILEKL
jgi:hypothetical protein